MFKKEIKLKKKVFCEINEARKRIKRQEFYVEKEAKKILGL